MKERGKEKKRREKRKKKHNSVMREQKRKQSYSKREQGSVQPTHARLDATRLAVLDVSGLGVSLAKNSGCVQYVIRPRVANTR